MFLSQITWKCGVPEATGFKGLAQEPNSTIIINGF